MAERIDELQLLIGSDASSAIRQLGNLAGALDNAATSARKLSSATGFANHFVSALSKLSSINLNRTIDGLEKLSRLNLNNLKDKKISIDLQVNGADRADRLKYATEQAAKSVTKNADQIAKALGQEYKMNPKSIAEMTGMVRDFVKEIKSGGDGSNVMDQIAEHIANTSKKATADILGTRHEMQSFVDWFNGQTFAPDKKVGGDAVNHWIKSGFLRNLDGTFGSDISSVWNTKEFQEVASGFVDLQETNPENMFWQLAEAINYCKSALTGYIDDFETSGATSERVRTMLDGVSQELQEGIDKRMAQSRNAIPLDLDIDQSRFEAKIQQAITQATSNKTYHAQPIQFDLDTKQLKQNIENTIASVDFGKLPQFANSFKQMSDAISLMNQTNFKDTGITQFTNAFRRLVSTDTSSFDVGAFRSIANSVKGLASAGDVSKSLNSFVSSIARLANAGYKTIDTADGLKKLTSVLKSTVKSFSKIKSIDATVTSFISSLAKLATAGDKTEKTASGLGKLTVAVMRFINTLSNAPEINQNIANTIQGLGNLAAAGNNAGKAMNTALSGGGGTGGHGIASTAVSKAIGGTVNSFKSLLGISLKLGGQGASALGSFLAKLHLIPSQAHGIDRTALSFTNLLRAILPFYGIRGLFEWGKEALESGSAIVELENVIDTSFGHLKKGYEDISGYIYKWAETTIDAFGVSQIAAERYAGRLMAMFNSSGFDVTEGMRDSAAKMTTDLIERAGDVASFYDITVDEAMTKFQSGLAGMTRPLRSLGINMSVANMEAFAMSQGITTAWKEMDQASQMALRYQYILNATQYAAGDFQKTQLSLANQCRLLSLNFQVLSTTIGQGLVSAIAPAIAWLNALIKRLIQAAVAFRTFMWTLFGKPLQAARGTADEMAGYLDDATSSAGGLADSVGGASDGLGSAGKAAKNLKKQLQVLPFDELNQLAKDTESAGSGGAGGSAGGGGGVGGIGDVGNLLGDLDTNFDLSGNKAVEAINKWAAEIKDAFIKKDWKQMGIIIGDGLNSGLAYLYDVLDWNKWEPRVKGFIRPFQIVVNHMVQQLDSNLLGKTVARGLNLITKTFRIWINGFRWRTFGKELAVAMNGMLDEIDADALGRAIADKFKAAWDFFGGWVRRFDFKKFGTRLKEGVLGFLDELRWTDMGESLAWLLNGISSTIIEFFEDGKVATELAESFSSLVNGFLGEFDSEKAKKAMGTVKESIKTALGEAIKTIDKEELKTDLVNLFTGLPWKVIGGLIGAKIGFDLVKGLIGVAFTKSVLSSAMTAALSGGSAMAAGASATGGATATAAAGASLTVGSIVGTTLAIAGITVGAIKLGQWLKKQGIGQSNVEENKKKAAKTISEGQTKNNQGLASQGLNAAGYNTQLMTAPASQTFSLSAKVDPSFTTALYSKYQLEKNPTVQKLLTAEQDAEYKKGRKSFIEWHDDKVEKRVNAKFNNAYLTVQGNWDKWDSETIKKTVNAGPNGAYNTTHSNWDRWISETIKKTTNAGQNEAYGKTKRAWDNWDSETITKTVTGKQTQDLIDTKKVFDGIYSKDVQINVIAKIKSDVEKIVLSYSDGMEKELARIKYFGNATGGLFSGPAAFQVFGEAGDEAAIPLERKSTMRKIANAIVDSGGMNGAGMNAGMAREIASAVAPYIMSAVSDANNRPVQVNATLYTENDEVLARAVTRGQKSIDKRYNPVSQFSY